MKSLISLVTLSFIGGSLCGTTVLVYFGITAALSHLLQPQIVASQLIRFSAGACSFFLSSCFSMWLIRITLPIVPKRKLDESSVVPVESSEGYVPKKLTGVFLNGDLSREAFARDAFSLANMKRLSAAFESMDGQD